MDDCFPFSAAIRLPRVLRCVGLGLHLAVDRRSSVSSSRVLNSTWRQPFKFGEEQGCSGARTRGTVSPTFFRQGTRPPLPPLFWTEIRAKVSPLLQLVTY